MRLPLEFTDAAAVVIDVNALNFVLLPNGRRRCTFDCV
jgi:hypothetical protein